MKWLDNIFERPIAKWVIAIDNETKTAYVSTNQIEDDGKFTLDVDGPSEFTLYVAKKIDDKYRIPQ